MSYNNTFKLSLILCFWVTAAAGCRETESRAASAETGKVLSKKPSAAKWEPQEELLDYVEVLTKGGRSREPLPLILAVHGLGGTPENFVSFFEELPVKARIIAPRAPTRWGVGFAWFTVRIRSGDARGLAKGIRAAADRVARLAEHLERTLPTEGRPILTGFSQGGMISYAVALNHPAAIGRAIPVSGTLPEPLWPRARTEKPPPPPITALHGTADSVVPFAPTRRMVDRLKKLGLDASLESFPGVDHTISFEMRARLYALIGEAVSAQSR